MLTGWRAAPILLTAAAAVLLAGCGGSGSQNAAQPQSPATAIGTGTGAGASAGATGRPGAARPAASASPPNASLTSCRTAGLTVTLDGGQAGGAAGSMYIPVDFTNSSRSACGLLGYPGVSFVTARGAQLGAAATRNEQFGSVQVNLAPGRSAHVWLQVAQAQNYPASSCQPASASGLRIYPPGNTAATYVYRSFAACRSTAAQVLTVTPLRAGRGMRGAMP